MEHRPLGYLDPVDPATVWRSEPGEFLPWLATEENLRRLGDALGLDHVPVAREAPVGRFRADLLCRDRGTDTRVVIEAQLNTSDHSHLGQLLTYAEGLGAGVVVWLGTRFHGEHHAVLGRINRSSDFRLRCFAVAIDLWKIGASLAAPRDWPGPAAGMPGHRLVAADPDAAPAEASDGALLGGNPFRNRRLSRGMTVQQVADAAGLSLGCVSNIETGRSPGTPKTLAAIARVLDAPDGGSGECEQPSPDPSRKREGRGQGGFGGRIPSPQRGEGQGEGGLPSRMYPAATVSGSRNRRRAVSPRMRRLSASPRIVRSPTAPGRSMSDAG